MNIRNYKISYLIYNFFKKNNLKHNISLYKKYGLKKRYFSSISSKDFKDIESPLNIYDSKDSSIEMPKNLLFDKLDKETKKSLHQWSKNGYAIIKNFYSEKEVDRYNNELNDLIECKKVKFGFGNKVMFAIHHSELLQNTGNNVKLLEILTLIMGKKVELYQSINFLNGSQQRTHSDFIHLTTFLYGNLIAVWVALEDINEDNGPLYFYPGTHKLSYVLNSDFDNEGSFFKLGDKIYNDYEDHIESIMSKNKFEKRIFTEKKKRYFDLAC